MMIYTDTKYRPKRKPKKTNKTEKTLSPLLAQHRRMEKKPTIRLEQPKYRREGTQAIPSLQTHVSSTQAPERKTYTGDRLMGIAVMHKSCLQPVFSQEEAQDAAKMRRS